MLGPELDSKMDLKKINKTGLCHNMPASLHNPGRNLDIVIQQLYIIAIIAVPILLNFEEEKMSDSDGVAIYIFTVLGQ